MLLKYLRRVAEPALRRCASQVRFYSPSKHKPDGENIAALLCKQNDLRVVPFPMPGPPRDHEVLIKMEAIGICGSDIHYYAEGRCGPFVVEEPLVLGHEGAGMVLEVGKKVKHLSSGDKIAIEPQTPCRRCSYCKGGKYNLCPDILFCATPPVDGNLQKFFVHDADFCFKLPNNMDVLDGALIEPLSVGVHACNQAKLRFGDVVLVTGAGPVGLCTMMAAKALGASTVIITDVLDWRLEKALEFGADCVYKMPKDTPHDQVANDIKEMLGEAPRVSIECSGFEQPINVAYKTTKTGGVVVHTGLGETVMMVPVADISTRELDVKGVFRYCNDYPTAIEMVRNEKVKLTQLITDTFPIEKTVEAFEAVRNRVGNPIKVIVTPHSA